MKNLQEIKSSLKYLRIAPRKVRLVADLIRRKQVDVAIATLSVTNKRASLPLLKLLKSAVANARNNFKLEPTRLYVKSIRVDGGPMFKRWTPRARGGVDPIQKKTSHVFLTLGVKNKPEEEKFKVFEEEKKKKKKIDKNKEEHSKEKDRDAKTDVKVKDQLKPKEEKQEQKRIFRRKAV